MIPPNCADTLASLDERHDQKKPPLFAKSYGRLIVSCVLIVAVPTFDVVPDTNTLWVSTYVPEAEFPERVALSAIAAARASLKSVGVDDPQVKNNVRDALLHVVRVSAIEDVPAVPANSQTVPVAAFVEVAVRFAPDCCTLNVYSKDTPAALWKAAATHGSPVPLVTRISPLHKPAA